jgi:hypothetical protein
VPLVKPVTVKGELAPDAVKPPGLDVTVYETVPLPVYAGTVNVTTAWASPAVAETLVGTPGVRPDWLALDPSIGIYLPLFLLSTISRVPLAFIYPGFSNIGRINSSTSLAMSSLDSIVVFYLVSPAVIILRFSCYYIFVNKDERTPYVTY